MGNVLQFAVAANFLLQEIIAPSSTRGVITAWLEKSSGARARFRVRLRDLRRIPRVEWTKKQFRSLGNGLFEIKWEWEKKQWRAIGFDHKGHFVMVLGCTHKDNVYDPANCLKTAKQRKAEAENGAWGFLPYEP